MENDDLSRSSAHEIDSSMSSSPPRRKSVHQALGGGAVAEVILWKRWAASAFLLVSTSIMWFLFEQLGYNLLSFVANVLLLLVLILFFWAKSASLLNRPLPPLPNMEVSDDFVRNVAHATRLWINRVLGIAQDIALGRNVKLFLQVTLGLWLISYIGSIFSFLTFVFIGVLLSLTLPALYDKYQDHFDDKLNVTQHVISTQYRKIEENILSRISKSPGKEKKIQ